MPATAGLPGFQPVQDDLLGFLQSVDPPLQVLDLAFQRSAGRRAHGGRVPRDARGEPAHVAQAQADREQGVDPPGPSGRSGGIVPVSVGQPVRRQEPGVRVVADLPHGQPRQPRHLADAHASSLALDSDIDVRV